MKPGILATTIGTLLFVIGSIGATAMAHDDGKAHEKIGLVMQQTIPEANGKQVTVATVHYAPGQASDAHAHPGSIFAYVTEGSVTSQLEGQPEKTYRKGEGWYEPPGAKHIVSKNASKTKPAGLIVWALGDKDQALVLPLPN